MPTIRILADGQPFLASPFERVQGQPGLLRYKARQGDTVQLRVDGSAWVGYGDTIAAAAWSGELTAASPTLTGSVASARFALSSDGCFDIACGLRTTAGRVINVPVRFEVETAAYVPVP